MPHICVSESWHHWFRKWLVAYSAPSHYLRQSWTIRTHCDAYYCCQCTVMHWISIKLHKHEKKISSYRVRHSDLDFCPRRVAQLAQWRSWVRYPPEPSQISREFCYVLLQSHCIAQNFCVATYKRTHTNTHTHMRQWTGNHLLMQCLACPAPFHCLSQYWLIVS